MDHSGREFQNLYSANFNVTSGAAEEWSWSRAGDRSRWDSCRIGYWLRRRGSHQCFCMARKFQPISHGSLSCQSQSAFRKQNQAIATRIRPGGMHSWSRWGLMTSKESPHRPLCCYLTEDAETPAVIPPTEPAEPHSRPILPQVMTLMYSSTFPNCGSSSLAVLTFTCSWGDVILLSAG